MELIKKILKQKTDGELIQLANELNMIFIPCDGLCRKIASEIFNVPVNETSLIQVIGIAPALALELSERFALLKKSK